MNRTRTVRPGPPEPPAVARIALPYMDPAVPVDDRVCDLLGRMTLVEKVAQLGSVWAFEIVPDGRIDHELLHGQLADGMGEITRLAGSTNLRAAEVVVAGNAIQRFLVEQTRLGVPAIFHEETLHGLVSRDALCFQQSIGAAATFDPQIVEAMATTHPATDARHGGAPRARAGARHRRGPTLGTDRGDLR